MSNKPMPHPIQQEEGIRVPAIEGEEPVDQVRQQNDAAREQADREKDLEKAAKETVEHRTEPLGATVEPPGGDQWVG